MNKHKWIYIIIWAVVSFIEVFIGAIGVKETYIGMSIILAAEMISDIME